MRDRLCVDVRVTDAHFAAADLRLMYGWPVALAVLDALPKCQGVDVGRQWIVVQTATEQFRARTPAAVAELLRRFDAREAVEAMAFRLEFEPMK